MKDMCKGCNSQKYAEYICYFESARMQRVCPCIGCLVQAACRVPCDKRDDAKFTAEDLYYERGGKDE